MPPSKDLDRFDQLRVTSDATVVVAIVSGAKSDRGDAKVLADVIRTDPRSGSIPTATPPGMLEYPIARAYTDARITTIYGGTTEIMKAIIGRSLGV